MLNYEYTQAAIAVPVASGAKITVVTVQRWTSNDHNAKTKHLLIRVVGEISERGKTWTEEWEWEWPDVDLKRLEIELGDIRKHNPDQRIRGELLPNEVYVQVYDWLRIGAIDEGVKKWTGYIRFTKDKKTMTSLFTEMPSLVAFRDSLYRAINVC